MEAGSKKWVHKVQSCFNGSKNQFFLSSNILSLCNIQTTGSNLIFFTNKGMLKSISSGLVFLFLHLNSLIFIELRCFSHSQYPKSNHTFFTYSASKTQIAKSEITYTSAINIAIMFCAFADRKHNHETPGHTPSKTPFLFQDYLGFYASKSYLCNQIVCL